MYVVNSVTKLYTITKQVSLENWIMKLTLAEDVHTQIYTVGTCFTMHFKTMLQIVLSIKQ